jgi:hypothetical protein
MSAQARLEAAIRQHVTRMEREFNARVQAAANELTQEWLDHHRKREAHYNAVIKVRRGFMKAATYRLIQRCLHPDQSASTEMLNRAFDAWTGLKLVMVDEKEAPADLPPAMPATLDELLKAKAAATAARRSKRAARSTKHDGKIAAPEKTD